MECVESTEKRDEDGNEPGAGAGGRGGGWEGVPKTTRALLRLPSRYGCAPGITAAARRTGRFEGGREDQPPEVMRRRGTTRDPRRSQQERQ